jgi:DNA/RNA endonuclease G (NUC1)
MMHNGKYEKSNNDWNLYTTSVDAIERSTGYDFFKGIPDILENQLEAKIYK